MKTVILCGGRGKRLDEFTKFIPKSMILVGGKPILWHICNRFKKYGFNDFIFCLGYKGNKIKEYFKDNEFNIQFIDMSIKLTKTERLLKVKKLIDNEFFLIYGDILININYKTLLKVYKFTSNNLVTCVPYEFEYGLLDISLTNKVISFQEKPWLHINAGIYILNKDIFSHIKKGKELEKDVLPMLCEKRKIDFYYHNKFWVSIDTILDLKKAEKHVKLL